MPLYVQLTVSLVAGCFFFCLALGLAGFLLNRKSNALPPVPLFPGSNFPGVFAYFYTFFFFSTFSVMSILGYMQRPAESAQVVDIENFIYNGIMQIMLYLPFMICYFTLPSRENGPTSIVTGLKWITIGLAAMLLPNHLIEISGFNGWLVEVTDCPPIQNVVEILRDGPIEIKIGMLVMAVIVAPITEECCFRGFLYNILKRWNGPVAAAIASSMLFSAVHTSLAQFIPLTLFALVQCVAYEKARSLWLPITLHMLFNAVSALAILLIL